ncbi:MAG: DUF4097 family beta strand repeat protein [Oscillospiraceae bacterium]|nr:DUF4097 family beta strand repeat protein [Oscillospiraceae bacterium]
MKKGIWIIVSIVLIITGAALCALSTMVMGFDPVNTSTVDYVENTYEVTGSFKNISIAVDTDDIEFQISQDGRCSVVCIEAEGRHHEAKINGSTLEIRQVYEEGWNFVGINSRTPIMTVYLPERSYNDLVMNIDTGDVIIPEGFTFADLEINSDTGDVMCKCDVTGDADVHVNTGEIYMGGITGDKVSVSSVTGDILLESINCSDAQVKSDTGDVELGSVLISGDAEFESDTGMIRLSSVKVSGKLTANGDTNDVELSGCDAGEIYIETNTGSITGSLLSGKQFVTETNVGDIDVPAASSGGKCELITNTGDISIIIAQGEV